MANMKRIITSPITTIVLFALAAVLLLFSTIGGARAALTYYSETYSTRVEMFDIGVTLVENGTKISWRDYGSAADGTWSENTGVLLNNLLADDEEILLGKEYPEVLAVTNSGTIDEYVRVSIYKYWIDENGDKIQTLSPSLIDLNLVNLGTDWLLDESASTAERTVLYYNRVLPVGAPTADLSDTLKVDSAVATKVTQETTQELRDGKTYTVITTTYDYDGYQFQLEAEVDAVQTHSAAQAIWSAWGRRVNIDAASGTLSLS